MINCESSPPNVSIGAFATRNAMVAERSSFISTGYLSAALLLSSCMLPGALATHEVFSNQTIAPVADSEAFGTTAPVKACSAKLLHPANESTACLLSVNGSRGVMSELVQKVGDGLANAPAGAPQVPMLLSGYLVRPWNVAGVDYGVGILRGMVLKDPAPGGVLVLRSLL
jgi:hypothetical protein